jgi:hypothetical protein
LIYLPAKYFNANFVPMRFCRNINSIFMVKTIGLLLATAAILFCSSCDKNKKGSITPATPSGTGKMKQVTIVGNNTLNATWLGVLTPCKKPGTTCVVMDDIVIKGYQRDEMVGTGVMSAGSVAQIFLKEDYRGICNALGSSITSDLQSGNYAMRKGFENAQTINFIVGTGEVNENHFEYAIQFSKQ